MKLDMIDMPRKQAYPARVTEFTLPFWKALEEGRFITTQCKACSKMTFPPKLVCPHCWSRQVEWTDVTPRGILYSWTRIHVAPSVFVADVPFSVAVVDLEQRVRIACRLIERPGLAPVPGSPVEIVVLRYQDGPLLAARPVAVISQ